MLKGLVLALLALGPALGSTPRGAQAATYRNPVLFADYSDPDVIRAGPAFYMTASSFASVPGLPILRSYDLVHWTVIGHAAPRMPSVDFATPQHGKGLWAPSLRHHAGLFWIYVGDPDRGIFVTTARDPSGPWSPLTLVKAAKGAIDPCPLWDDDGRVYLVHAWARSRAGFNSILTITPLSEDGRRVAGPDQTVFDGHAAHPTIEGPKFYKRDGWYYIFAPAGGVATGWQTVLRSRSVTGPYEDRVVMRQGRTAINGPHQGGLVEDREGTSWFLHFQDRGAYGRVVHLQPVVWRDGWPVIGVDADGDGVGEPVFEHAAPASFAETAPARASVEGSDEFDAGAPGLQWQGNAEPSESWIATGARGGFLRLRAVKAPADSRTLFDHPALLLQKIPAEGLVMTSRLDITGLGEGAEAGLVIAGRDTAALSLRRGSSGLTLVSRRGASVDRDGRDVETNAALAATPLVWLRARIEPRPAANPAEDAPVATFAWSVDGLAYHVIGEPFTIRPGVWVGARLGLFALASPTSARPGFADIDWFRLEALK